MKPASQQREDYPKDYRARIVVGSDAALGIRSWSCSTVQGVTAGMKFVVGDLPEIVEDEIEGPQDPVVVSLPVTINGRVFPREDLDDWSFVLRAGTRVTCEIQTRGFGSPLQSVMELFGPDGKSITAVESSVSRAGDPALVFVAANSGAYRVRVREVAFGGGQAHVYRLSLYEGGRVQAVFPLGARAGEDVILKVHQAGSEKPVERTVRVPATCGVHAMEIPGQPPGCSGVVFDVSDLSEAVRWSAKEVSGLKDGFAPVPGVLNGCIASPGETHEWRLRLEPSSILRAEVIASALGSRLDSVLTLVDGQGREVAKNDDAADGRPDSSLQYSAAKGGEFTLRISERFARRGGVDFGYRLRLGLETANEFQLRLASDFFNAVRARGEPAGSGGKTAPKPPGLKVELVGTSGLPKEIRLEIAGLPDGVDFEPKVIPPKAKSVDLRFSAGEKAALGAYPIRISGTFGEGDAALRRTAGFAGAVGAQDPTAVRLAVVPHVPFRFVGEYWVTNDQPAGTSMRRTYRIERGGYEGPLRVMLSDKQIRCLQRLTARPIDVAPGADSFEFTVDYPTEVQLGWTSRVQLMLVGTFRDEEGRERPISYTSFDVDDQMISVVAAGLLGVSLERASFPATPGTVEIPVRVRRHEMLSNTAVRLGLRVPPHIKGVHASEVCLGPAESEGVLRARVDPGAGPFNIPMEIVATTIPGGPAQAPHTAALPIEFIQAAGR